MSQTTDRYMTKSGNIYSFRFVRVADGYYEADIVIQPSYQHRATDLHSTHRLSSSRGGNKVCFGEPSSMNSLSKVKTWAVEWAEASDRYISTGARF